MSRATMQQLALVSVIHSGVKAVRECHDLHAPLFVTLVDEALEATQEMVVHWSITGDEARHLRFCELAMKAWQEFLNVHKDSWSMVADLGISVQICDELHCRLTDRGKRDVLAEILAKLMKISDWLDPYGRRIEEYEFSNRCIGELYRIIEF